MNRKVCVAVALALLCTGAVPVSEAAYAEEIDFDRIDKFESLSTGTLHVGSPPKPLSMMASDTSSFSRSGTPMPKPKFIGDRWMATPPKQRSYPGKASRPFKRPESSGSRLSANQIGKSNTDTFCLG